MKILNIIGIAVICYLLGAFCSASFNIAEWTPFCRFIISFIIGILLIAYVTYVSIVEKED